MPRPPKRATSLGATIVPIRKVTIIGASETPERSGE